MIVSHIPSSVPFTIRTEMGPAAKRIQETAENSNCDLIVMGTRGLSGMEAFLLGSVTSAVLHNAWIPVMVVCKPRHDFLTRDPDHPVEITRILCAIEPQTKSISMIRTALSLAKEYQARLLFFQVDESTDLQEEMSSDFDFVRRAVSPEDLDWCEVQYVVEIGNAAEQILRAADEIEPQLLVMGHHTRQLMAAEVLGSVALKVVRNCSCPVLVMPE
jgi:nucleotide-binding universal stress UspA family protein